MPVPLNLNFSDGPHDSWRGFKRGRQRRSQMRKVNRLKSLRSRAEAGNNRRRSGSTPWTSTFQIGDFRECLTSSTWSWYWQGVVLGCASKTGYTYDREYGSSKVDADWQNGSGFSLVSQRLSDPGGVGQAFSAAMASGVDNKHAYGNYRGTTRVHVRQAGSRTSPMVYQYH
ncbi:hypothetical protein BDV98DRAFT_626479 [Pterulicium gracile]|uniref:Uncharacterized protein n=1 Tax=Pterulicium gracile TaxID=1884261 RepID=A0A5C3QB88_9AGAR|nr:hypothetical protein BDV98DRAFT_626479 [Pterula gracilis]